MIKLNTTDFLLFLAILFLLYMFKNSSFNTNDKNISGTTELSEEIINISKIELVNHLDKSGITGYTNDNKFYIIKSFNQIVHNNIQKTILQLNKNVQIKMEDIYKYYVSDPEKEYMEEQVRLTMNQFIEGLKQTTEQKRKQEIKLIQDNKSNIPFNLKMSSTYNYNISGKKSESVLGNIGKGTDKVILGVTKNLVNILSGKISKQENFDNTIVDLYDLSSYDSSMCDGVEEDIHTNYELQDFINFRNYVSRDSNEINNLPIEINQGETIAQMFDRQVSPIKTLQKVYNQGQISSGIKEINHEETMYYGY